MGEKIKILSKGKLLNREFEIELNYPTVTGGEQQIHLQSDKYRFELDKSDFISLAFSVLVAEKNLKNLKKL